MSDFIKTLMADLDACGWGVTGERRRLELLTQRLPDFNDDQRWEVIDGVTELYEDKGVIKSRVICPESHDRVTSGNGWLSPKGNFYPCKYHEHLNLASRIRRMTEGRAFGNSEYELEAEGWIKVQTIDKRVWFFHNSDSSGETRPKKPTKAQVRAVTDYCVANKCMDCLPHWWED